MEGRWSRLVGRAVAPDHTGTGGGPLTEAEGGEVLYLDYVWPYVACFNASGHPAIQIPLGLDADGLPVGVQVVGPYWSEPELLRFAALLAERTPGFVRPTLG